MNALVKTSTRSVLVLGACGRLGGALLPAFTAAGWRVLAHTRRAEVPAQVGVTWLRGPLDQVGAQVRAAGGAAVVVHAMNPPYTRWDTELLPQADAALGVARALDARLLFAGNVYAYGPPLPALIGPATPPLPGTQKGALRATAEARLRASGVPTVVVRAGDFFGSGHGSWLDLVVAKALRRKGRIVYPGPLDLPHAWAYLPDLAQGFVAVAEAEQRLATYEELPFAGHTVTGTDWVEALTAGARDLGWLRPGQTPQVAPMPWGWLRLAGLVVPMAREVAAMRFLWDAPHQLDGVPWRARLGTPAQTPFAQAVRAALMALR